MAGVIGTSIYNLSSCCTQPVSIILRFLLVYLGRRSEGAVWKGGSLAGVLLENTAGATAGERTAAFF